MGNTWRQLYNIFLPGLQLLLLSASSNAETKRIKVEETSSYSDRASQPFFLPSVRTNITTTKSQTAYLHCRISNPEDEEYTSQVSWIRKKDLHVLSSGMIVFSTDQRFQVIHRQDSQNWTLQIKYAQYRDAGIYECQLNTNPKKSKAFQLNVIEAKAVIQGPEYVKSGSTIKVTCTINQDVMAGLVYWYLNRDILNYEENQVRIVTTGNETVTTSQLTIYDAQPSHSGNLTCWPTSANPSFTTINVVVDGEQPAAMQTSRAKSTFLQPLTAVSGLLISCKEILTNFHISLIRPCKCLHIIMLSLYLIFLAFIVNIM